MTILSISTRGAGVRGGVNGDVSFQFSSASRLDTIPTPYFFETRRRPSSAQNSKNSGYKHKGGSFFVALRPSYEVDFPGNEKVMAVHPAQPKKDTLILCGLEGFVGDRRIQIQNSGPTMGPGQALPRHGRREGRTPDERPILCGPLPIKKRREGVPSRRLCLLRGFMAFLVVTPEACAVEESGGIS